MQISRVVVGYDVKLSQLGRKNLAVRFNLIRINGAAPVAGREEICETPARGVGSISGMEHHESFEHAFKGRAAAWSGSLSRLPNEAIRAPARRQTLEQ
jgi:hypothetical protein